MDTTKLKSRMSDKLNAPQTEPTLAESNPAESMSSEIAAEPSSVFPLVSAGESEYIALTSDALGIISENLKNQQLSHALFDIVKSPSGGTTAFTVPGLSGDEVQKELVGIILDYTTPRAYWDTPDPKEGTPPVCYSKDSVTSHEGKPCSLCQFNDFGSKDGESNGKACKESVHIFLLRQELYYR